jgi:hypothetical protein
MWDGPDPSDRVICPYPVEFYCKPSPAESLNSIESGRILLELQLGADVGSVIGRLLNRAKSENLDKLQDGDSKIKHQNIPRSSSGSNFYSLEITYTLDNNNSCTARFFSDDAFHWHARSK